MDVFGAEALICLPHRPRSQRLSATIFHLDTQPQCPVFPSLHTLTLLLLSLGCRKDTDRDLEKLVLWSYIVFCNSRERRHSLIERKHSISIALYPDFVVVFVVFHLNLLEIKLSINTQRSCLSFFGFMLLHYVDIPQFTEPISYIQQFVLFPIL